MRAPDQHLPPWKACCESERKAFIDWTIEQLERLDIEDDAYAADLLKRWNGTIAPEVAFQADLYRAKASARSGNPKALAKLLAAAVGDPEIADFDIIPRRERWQHRPKPVDRAQAWAQHAEDDLARRVIADVDRMRQEIWPQHYDGKSNRPQHGDFACSAEAIAGMRWKISEAEVRRIIKDRSR